MKASSAALLSHTDPHLNNDEPQGRGPAPSGRPIDLVHLARQTFGDKRLETELLRLFMRQADHIRNSLEGVSEQACGSVPCVELMHMLSGSARVIGASDVAALAGSLEADLRLAPRNGLGEAERRSLGEALGTATRYIAELLDHG